MAISTPSSLLRTAARPVGRPLVRLRRRRERDRALARLKADDHPDVAAVGRALAAAVAEPAQAEQAWIAEIEGLRGELGRSHEVIRNPRSVWTGDPADDMLRERTVSHLALHASKPARWGRVLLHLIPELRLRRCLELGTCVGISAAYQAAALELTHEGGSVVTLEADAPRVELARANLDRLGLSERVEVREGRFDETLDDVLQAFGQLDFAFIDGHHKEGPTLDYFQRIAARLARPAVLLFDDIGGSEGMARAWSRISADRRVRAAIDLGGLGLALVADGANGSGEGGVGEGGSGEGGVGEGETRRLAFALHPR